MKQIYFLIIIFTISILSTMSSQAQTYSLDFSGNGTCENPGIDATYICLNDGGSGIDLGSFTDTNVSGTKISTMSLVIYGACSGDVEFFINGTSVVTGTASGLSCSCQSISSDPNIPQNYEVTLTPAILAAYAIGGNNTLSVMTTNSITFQCFYGADIVVNSGTLDVENFGLNVINVYPNPTSDFITITGLKNSESYKIYDALGTEILGGIISDNEKIDIKNYSIGLYFFKFENGNTIKFIKE